MWAKFVHLRLVPQLIALGVGLSSPGTFIASEVDPQPTTVGVTTVLRLLDVVYVPTPQPTVDAMLRIADVGRHDLVIDLGCGDARIAITAAMRHGARSRCIELDAALVREAEKKVRVLNLDGRVEIIHGDALTTDLSGASVVTLYLSAELNRKLKPKLLAELRPGTRIVSHHFEMDDWKPVQTLRVGEDRIFLWRVPARSQADVMQQ